MKTKNIFVSFLAIVSVLLLVANVTAADFYISEVTVDGVNVLENNASVIAGETVDIKVYFDALSDASDVRIKAEIEGDKVDVDVRTDSFDVEDNHTYKKVLSLKVPYELKDDVSDDITLTLKISGGDVDTLTESYDVRVQRPSYNAAVKSVTTTSSVSAGETIPVDVVLKNMGYNDLDDLYVTASIPALKIEKKAYFGDLVSIENCSSDCDDNEEDTVSGRLYLTVPYDAVAGTYALNVEVTNDDTTTNVVKEIVIGNDFAGNVIVTTLKKNAGVGEEAQYDLLLVNPTNKLKVYRVVTESGDGLSSSTSDSVVAIPAGSSKTITVTASADSEGEYNFNVNVISGESTVNIVTLTLNAEGNAISSSIVALTVILAIIFIVLLVVLIVLLGKKPQKSEDFGESYY